jgi:uncharacterized protein YbaR (Trm112 family)
MREDTLDLLRCPYCGGRLELVTSLFHRRDRGEIADGILGCHCCVFPVIDGIPVLHLLPGTTRARELVENGEPALARRAMLDLDDPEQAERFDTAATSPDTTYRDLVEALGPSFEGGYFLYRFSDPTYLVAHAVVQAVAGTVLAGGGRAVDLCGGSGHLTRLLLDLSTAPPVLADLYFAKAWLGRRFTAPGAEAVCCDGNSPLPFARGTFRYAMCSDAFQYIWTKRLFVQEMLRLVDGAADAAVVINHTHNQRTWSPSHGQPLPPEGYADLFETIEPHLFGEAGLFADVLAGGPIDLSRRDTAAALDADPALTIVASRNPRVFAPHALEPPLLPPRGVLRVSPLYVEEPDEGRLRLRLRFPSDDYADEYAASRRYLPDQVMLEAADVAALQEGRPTATLKELMRRRVVVDLPLRYY